jgi:hypothetical protein
MEATPTNLPPKIRNLKTAASTTAPSGDDFTAGRSPHLPPLVAMGRNWVLCDSLTHSRAHA